MNDSIVDELKAILKDDFRVELSKSEADACAQDYVAFFGTLVEIALAEKQKLIQNDEDQTTHPL